MLYRCPCLNVSVNLATRIVPVPFSSEHVSALVSGADMDRIGSAELLGNAMDPVVPELQSTRELGGGWTVWRCLNCNFDCYGSHCTQPRRLFVNTKMEERDSFTLRSHPDYSAAFGIIIRDDLCSGSDQPGNEANLDVQHSKTLSAPVEELLEKERKGMQSRIAAFITAQQERYRSVQQRALRDQRILRKKIMYSKNLSQLRPSSDGYRSSSSSGSGSSVTFSSSVPSRASSLSELSKQSPYSSSLRPALVQASRSSQLGPGFDPFSLKAALPHSVAPDMKHRTPLSSTSTPLEGTPEDTEVLVFTGAAVPSQTQVATTSLPSSSDPWLAADHHRVGDTAADSELFVFEDDVPSYRALVTPLEMSEIEEEHQESEDGDESDKPHEPATSQGVGEEPPENMVADMSKLFSSSVPVDIPKTGMSYSASHRHLSNESRGRLLTPAMAEDDRGGRGCRHSDLASAPGSRPGLNPLL